MERTIVKGSSNLKELGYDPSTKTLQVKFRNKAIYDYTPVEAQQVEELLEADSKGGYLHNKIIQNPEITSKRVG